MAQNFYNDGFHVYYGVHKKDDKEKHLHVHFAVNTMYYEPSDRKKRHENKTAMNQVKTD